jgi:hypothetical protein
MEWGVASPTRCDAMQRKDRSMMNPGSGAADLLAPKTTTTMKRKTKANAAGGRKEGIACLLDRERALFGTLDLGLLLCLVSCTAAALY